MTEADDMRERVNRVLGLLQPAPLPVDLVDNPYRTDQWLNLVNNLHQAVLLLLGCGGTKPADSRADRLMRRFARLTDGLPQSCLSGLPAVTKLGLLRPLLADLESRARRIAEQDGTDLAQLDSRLGQYRAAAAAMAARLTETPPDGRLRPAGAVPGH